MESNLQKPCIVQTPQGFSVSYNQKFLYSKYNPSKSIIQTIEALEILPGTLILCCSPILDYGIAELYKKLPENCFALACEFNQELRDFAQENNKCIPFLSENELYNLPVLLNKKNCTLECGAKLPEAGTFKRILRVDFSAGVSFSSELYQQLTAACINSIKTFWSNRITLTKFGRKYSQNFFRNLHILDRTVPIESYFSSIAKPIIVFGAGESLSQNIKKIAENRDNFFILCADTALQPLLSHNIEPDIVVIEEAQSVISKAFIGTQNHNFQIFAGLSSLPNIAHQFPEKRLSFFTTKYTDARFLDKLTSLDLLPPSNNPFGSVGLTAVYYALKLRKDTSIPVYIYGLDFSYSKGHTHTNGTIAHKQLLLRTSKLSSTYNFAAAFNQPAEAAVSKHNEKIYTTPTLANYAALFAAIFYNQESLFDASDSGLSLNLPHKLPDFTARADSSKTDKPDSTPQETCFNYSKDFSSGLENYFTNERKALLNIKELMTQKSDLTQEELFKRITELLEEREYLYLHFADGYKFSPTQSLLNRVRTEIDFFLKFI